MILRRGRDTADIEHSACARVVAYLVDLAIGQARIYYDRPGIHLARSEHKGREREAVLADDHHPVARPNCEMAQRNREFVDNGG
jgi:hypothetical protein